MLLANVTKKELANAQPLNLFVSADNTQLDLLCEIKQTVLFQLEIVYTAVCKDYGQKCASEEYKSEERDLRQCNQLANLHSCLQN